MKVIRTILKDRAALKERFLSEMQHGGLFIPKAVDLSVGETVCLWLQLRSLDAELHLYGIVYWLRHRSDGQHQHLRTGAGVGFRAGQDDQVEFLRRALGSRLPGFSLRRPTRTPLLNPWRCSIRTNGSEPRAAVVTDISREGAQCMVGTLPVEPGQTIELLLPWHSETPHLMEVAWKRPADTRFRLGLRRRASQPKAEREWNELAERARRLFTSQIWTRTSQSPLMPPDG